MELQSSFGLFAYCANDLRMVFLNFIILYVKVRMSMCGGIHVGDGLLAVVRHGGMWKSWRVCNKLQLQRCKGNRRVISVTKSSASRSLNLMIGISIFGTVMALHLLLLSGNQLSNNSLLDLLNWIRSSTYFICRVLGFCCLLVKCLSESWRWGYLQCRGFQEGHHNAKFEATGHDSLSCSCIQRPHHERPSLGCGIRALDDTLPHRCYNTRWYQGCK